MPETTDLVVTVVIEHHGSLTLGRFGLVILGSVVGQLSRWPLAWRYFDPFGVDPGARDTRAGNEVDAGDGEFNEFASSA